MSDQNKLVARQFVERFLNTADPAVLDDLTTPGYIDHDLPSGITPRQSVTVFRAAFPDARFTVEDVIGESDRVAVRYRIEGTHTGDFFGMPASGKRIRIGGISIYRLSGGRLTEAWVQYDQAGLMGQLQAA